MLLLLLPLVVPVAPLLLPLQPPAPQLALPVELPLAVVPSEAPLHDALPLPPDVEDVLVSVVDDEPDDPEPPPHAESPSSADAATASEAFVFMFIWTLLRCSRFDPDHLPGRG